MRFSRHLANQSFRNVSEKYIEHLFTISESLINFRLKFIVIEANEIFEFSAQRASPSLSTFILHFHLL